MLITGVDIVEIPRIRRIIQEYGDRFIYRIYTEEEIVFCRGRPAQFARRFAAKEAAMKALGTGRSSGVLWKNIEVVRVSGPPQLKFNGAASRIFNDLGCRGSLVTITHSSDLALAQVMLLGS